MKLNEPQRHQEHKATPSLREPYCLRVFVVQ